MQPSMITQTKIQINNGRIAFERKPKIKTAKCKWCGQKIYCVKTKFDKTILASKTISGEFISHFLVCPKRNRFRE